MKYLLCYLFTLVFFQGCAIKTGANNLKSNNFTYFSCKDTVIKKPVSESITIIKAEELRSCFLKKNDRIIWISSYWQGCASQDVINQKKLYDKFKDKVELIIISETFDISEIKKLEQQINYPIYFIDPSYDSSRLKNASEYMKNVLKENVTEEALKHTNIFIKNGKVINVAYNANLSEDFFSNMF